MPAQESRHATGLSWVYNHAGADAGLDRGGRVLEVYLEHILTVFSRLGHNHAPSLQRSQDTGATFSSRTLNFRPLLFYFKVRRLSGVLFDGFGSLQRLQGILSWIQLVDPEIIKCDGATKSTICRVGSYVSPVTNMPNYGFAARNSSARPNCALCAENLLLSDTGPGVLALPEPSVGRKNGLFSPIGHLNSYRFASRNPGARPYSGRARS